MARRKLPSPGFIPVASGTVASAAIAVTLTAGSADVELSSETIPRNYQGHLLRITDANNVVIQGFVYTNGAGTVQNIVSAKGGTTRNWATQDAGFDDTTNCTYVILKVLTAPVVATGSITAGNALIDATAANAFAAPVGVDLSAYQDGRHILAMYNTTGGYAAIAHISATAPSGEALGEENVDGWTNSGFDTFTAVDPTAITEATEVGANNVLCRDSMASLPGGLYKGVIGTFTLTSGTRPSFRMGASNTGLTGVFLTHWDAEFVDVSDGAHTAYFTQNKGIYFGFRNITGVTSWTASGMSLKQVTMPAATGVLLLSSKGGSRGYMYKHESFDPRAAMTYKVLFWG